MIPFGRHRGLARQHWAGLYRDSAANAIGQGVSWHDALWRSDKTPALGPEEQLVDQHAFKAARSRWLYGNSNKGPRPEAANEEHGQHFSVRGLVLADAFIVRHDNQGMTYGPGQVFAVAQGVAQCEKIGADGARVIVGRKD
jgi:hypothetical protein